ncbi:MAG: hypothetical protein PHT13_06880, partial [Methanosarcina sp.]|nr:hypothetical protein [Methanosarcina sp.]
LRLGSTRSFSLPELRLGSTRSFSLPELRLGSTRSFSLRSRGLIVGGSYWRNSESGSDEKKKRDWSLSSVFLSALMSPDSGSCT